MKRLLPFVIFILLLIGAILLLPFLLRPEKHRLEITNPITSFFRRPVVIGPISMGYWPPTLRLDQVAVMKEGSEPLLEISRVTSALDWKALFRLKLVPSDVELQQGKLTITRHP